MIYLYTYYTIVFLFLAGLLYVAWDKAIGWVGRCFVGITALFAVSTATIIGLLHSWTGEGFGYFASVLRQIGVAI